MKYAALFLMAVAMVILSVVLSYKRQSRVSKIFLYFIGVLFIWTMANIVLDILNEQDLAEVHQMIYEEQ